ncbi:MAG TPA: DUF4255 domain-containing protein [Cyanobacteria bacterium UBA8803]|nr:DUF4255 domain-containing protein [Cyanobacteria bacterium UBA9273]HBL60509.1 DUF4255 domain-containing protein [Cyanobacteria bacterium UBA8803]
MSNHLAIATVTATLQRILQTAVQLDVDGARVTTVRPNDVGTATPQIGVNLYLYHVSLNHAFRQAAEVQMRSRSGQQAKQARTALDLHYMISFYGNEVELEPQRLMGSVMRTLNDRRSLTPETVQEAIADSNYSYLIDSNLSDQLEELTFMPLDLSLEDLSKVWSVFFQTPYILSVAYRVRAVMIEGEQPAQKALPIRGRSFDGIASFPHQPKIDRVIAQAGMLEPILADSTVLIQGKNLKSDITQVWIDGMKLTPTEVSDTQINLALSSLPADTLRAGMHSLQVIHRIPRVTQPASNNGLGANWTSSNGGQIIATSTTQPSLIPAIQSNVIPFAVRPTVTKVSLSKRDNDGEELRRAEVKVRTNITIGKKQRVILILNEASIENPAAYIFEAAPRRADSLVITVPIYGVKIGRYLVRLQIDGAESQLTVDTNPNSATFNQYISPRIVIK